MTHDEVMALSDKELRVKAAELMGFDEDAIRYMQVIPDYHNDIAAAWELWKALEVDGFIASLENSVRGDTLVNLRRGKQDVFIRDRQRNEARTITGGRRWMRLGSR